MSFLDLLSLYGPGVASQGQPIGGASSPVDMPSPQVTAKPASPTDPAERIGGEKHGGFDWKALLAGGLGSIGAGLLGGGQGAAAFATNFANAKHQQNLQLREQEHQTQKAIADEAHKAWQEIQGQDWSSLPPELSHLSGKAQELNQKYITAIAKDSPGGVAISPKEAQEIIALSSVLRGVKDKVGAFQAAETKTNEAARPYTSGLMAGTLEPPPSIEGMLDSGMDEQAAAQRGGRELFQQAELARQQYDTPRQIPGFGWGTPKDELALKGQAMQMEKARLQQIAADERQDKSIRAAADRQAAALEASFSRLGAQMADRDARFDRTPVPIQGTDEDGNPTTQVWRRDELGKQIDAQGGGPISINKPLPNAERLKTKEASNALQQINEAGALFKPEYVGPAAGRLYDLAEKMPDLGQIDPARSAFAAQNKTIMNATIKLITGAQMSQQEADRILGQVPTVNDPPAVWQAKYKQTKRNAENMQRTMGGGLPPPPGMPGNKPKSDPLGILN